MNIKIKVAKYNSRRERQEAEYNALFDSIKYHKKGDCFKRNKLFQDIVNGKSQLFNS